MVNLGSKIIIVMLVISLSMVNLPGAVRIVLSHREVLRQFNHKLILLVVRPDCYSCLHE